MIMLIHLPILLPDLPYPKNALEPYISARTLEFHHGKHHQAYVDNANKLLPEMVRLMKPWNPSSKRRVPIRQR